VRRLRGLADRAAAEHQHGQKQRTRQPSTPISHGGSAGQWSRLRRFGCQGDLV